jgi:uncharacterized damage-inducible protein DinB
MHKVKVQIANFGSHITQEKPMKLDFRCRACTAAVTLLMVAPVMWAGPKPQMPQAPSGTQAQSTVLKDLVKDWQGQKTTMMAIADAMPEEKFVYKTTPPQRNYGEQVMHIALINVQLLKLIGGKAAPPSFTAQSTKSKAEILKAMSDSYDYGIALLNEQTDATLIQTVPAPAFLGASTRARIFWTLLAHSMDIYGQMAVYLRLNGVVPPASRRSIP